MMQKEEINEQEISQEEIPTTLPILPLRDVVIFPYMIFPILVGRESSIKAVGKAIEANKMLLVCSQIDATIDETTPDNLYPQGTVTKILQVLKLPNGLMKVLVDGIYHAKVEEFHMEDKECPTATIRLVSPRYKNTTRLKALTRQLDSLFDEYVRLHRDLPNETLIGYESLKEADRKLFYVAANLLVSVDIKESILQIEKIDAQLYKAIQILTDEINIMKVELEIDSKVHSTIQRSQRKYFIQEQIRILQRELGEGEDDGGSEFDELHKKLLDSAMPEEAMGKALEELDKLRKMPMMSPEATVSRNYLDWLLSIPWKKYTPDNLSLHNAETVLNDDHYGLEKPKERILEHIAVLNLVKEMKGQILCFVGPPGVGKTSLGRSIARALNRKFVRISLGGIHDEAEIRGHRRTYIGSMPGKIVQAIRKSGTMNPVLLLDEVDKMSNDFHGDPSSAMLEVLDPEQNHTFNDHYLDIDFDLSKVMFITTANVRYHIPLPLQDRMEIIELPGYLEHEKLEIAKRHLISKQIEMHGLKGLGVRFENAGILKIIREYTMEAGVRNLEREIATICRKIAKQAVREIPAAKHPGKEKKPRASFVVTPALVEEFLGVPRQRMKRVNLEGKIGSVVGLAWTSTGGDILHVDVSLMGGAEKLTLTGQLGEIMKESAQAALSFLRSHADSLDLPPFFYEKKEIHIHLPEGAIPKDGPSAGLTMTMAIYSALKKIPAPGTIAMTGEITLHGDILPIGGLNEKLLAARRHGVKTVLIPKENEPGLKEISDKIKKDLNIIPVATINECIPLIFGTGAPKKSPIQKKKK